jgi:putative ABC transport system permease protein
MGGMETFWQDIRYGIRILARSPGFTVVVVLILAVGIGVNTAVFSVIHAVLFRALPYDQPDRIVRIWEHNLQHGMSKVGSSHQHLVYWREHNHVFEHVAGMQLRRAYVAGLDKSYHVIAVAVSSCFFSLMGAQPALGRSFLPEEEQAGKEQVVVLSHGFWRDRLGSDPHAVGRDLILDGKPYRIVGVMPAGFRHSLRRDVPFWMPLVLDPQGRGGGTGVLARLRPAVTLKQARAEMNILEARLAEMDPKFFSGYTVTVDSFLSDELANNRTLLYVLWGAVGLVLLVACTNAAGLFLVHGSIRQKEMAVRAALGASRRRIVRQMLTEGLLLSLAAGLLGLLLALGAIKGLIRMCPTDIPRMNETGMNLPVLFFALGLSLLTGLLFSLLPAWKAADIHLSRTMKGASAGAAVGHCGRHLRKGLVVAQMGVALTLLMGIGVLVRSLINMQRQDLGFRPQGVLVAHIELPQIKYPSQAQWAAFYEQLLHGVQSLSGVQSAAIAAGGLDLSTEGGFIDFSIDGRPPADPRDKPTARAECVSPDFHRALGLTVVRGREFTEQDLHGNPGSVIIDETLARKYFQDVDPLGQRIDGRTIVGIVARIRDYEELDPSVCTLYLPIHQYHYLVSDLIVRTEGDPLRWSAAIREQVSLLDKEQEVSEIHTLEKSLADMLAPRQFTTILLAVFAQITLLLAAVGLYGVVQYTVTQGTHDLGIRMALGARRVDVLLAVLRQGLTVGLLGVVVGVAGALAITRVLASLLYDVSPTDPATLAVVSLVLIGMALLASYVPARRAARIDPMVALRYE